MSTKPAKKKKAVATPNQDAAKDINAVLKPDPLIDLNQTEEEISPELLELLPSIKEGDTLALTTWKTLKAMGWKEEKEPVKKVAKPVKPGKAKKEKRERTPSNKEVLYLAWKKNSKLEGAALLKVVAGAVKEKTVAGWLKGWKKGKRLPAIARK